MVREIGVIYGEELDSDSLQSVMAVLAGVSKGVSLAGSAAKTKVLMSASGNRIATQVTKSKMAGYIPMVGPVAMASVNMTTTYVIGVRATKYFERGEEGMASWEDSVRAVTGIDERKLVAWMKEAIVLARTNVVKTVKSGGLNVVSSVAKGGINVVTSVAQGGQNVVNTVGSGVSNARRSVVANMNKLLTKNEKPE